uniref:Uncharacterized protein n=1 Tax=Arundo donax TaxID=35708 RepID=A0A0A9BTV4_ARUDO
MHKHYMLNFTGKLSREFLGVQSIFFFACFGSCSVGMLPYG